MKQNSDRLNSISSEIFGIAVKVLFAVCLLFVFFKGITYAYEKGYEAFYASAAEEEPGHEIRITVSSPADVKETAGVLKRRGIISSTLAFEAQAAFFSYDLKPGTYTVNSSKTVREILEILDAGPGGTE